MALLEVESLSKTFPLRPNLGAKLHGLLLKGSAPTSWLHAVDKVDFQVRAGEALGIVGESGSGKSTLLRLLARLIDPTSGSIRFAEQRIDQVTATRFARSPLRAELQMVFQDHTGSLNPQFKIFDTVADPVRLLLKVRSKRELVERVEKAAERVALRKSLLDRYPHQLSGGERARAGLARAISVEPRLLLLDEPTSALDVSVQSVVLHLLDQLRRDLGLTYIFVSHDLNVVRLLCDRVLVMYSGKIVEHGPAQSVFDSPRHPYTRALTASILGLRSPSDASAFLPSGEPSGAIDPNPDMCRYATQCVRRVRRCDIQLPELSEVGPLHSVACHLPLDKVHSN